MSVKGLGDRVASVANWFNEHVMASPWTYLFCMTSVVVVYIVCAFQGYAKWNTSTGLFFNTLTSSVELITGVGATLGVYAVRKSHKELHTKLDRLSDPAPYNGQDTSSEES
jgi:hypothetical protein